MEGEHRRPVGWYRRPGQEWEHRFEPGLPAFVSIVRGKRRLFLSEHSGDARPDTLLYLRVADVWMIAKELASKGWNKTGRMRSRFAIRTKLKDLRDYGTYRDKRATLAT